MGSSDSQNHVCPGACQHEGYRPKRVSDGVPFEWCPGVVCRCEIRPVIGSWDRCRSDAVLQILHLILEWRNSDDLRFACRYGIRPWPAPTGRWARILRIVAEGGCLDAAAEGLMTGRASRWGGAN